MKNIYNAKHYLEEILLGGNTNGIGFVNESLNGYFRRTFNFSGNTYLDYSSAINSVGLLRNGQLEIGVNAGTLPNIDLCQCFGADVCRKLSLNRSHLRITAQASYKPQYINIRPGSKIAHHQLAIGNSYGTLGGILFDQQFDGNIFIISNNHVLANSNNARIGDNIYKLENGYQKIGELSHFVKFDPYGENHVDLAIAELPNFVNKRLSRTGNRRALIGENVYKDGGTTGRTQGVVRSLNYTAKIDMGNFDAVFVDQLQVTSMYKGGQFSKPGDSGALIKSSKDGSVIGLLFAGNESWTLANHQELIMGHFKNWGFI